MVSKKKKKKDNNIRSLIIFIGLFSVILVATVFNDIRVIKKNREETNPFEQFGDSIKTGGIDYGDPYHSYQHRRSAEKNM